MPNFPAHYYRFTWQGQVSPFHAHGTEELTEPLAFLRTINTWAAANTPFTKYMQGLLPQYVCHMLACLRELAATATQVFLCCLPLSGKLIRWRREERRESPPGRGCSGLMTPSSRQYISVPHSGSGTTRSKWKTFTGEGLNSVLRLSSERERGRREGRAAAMPTKGWLLGYVQVQWAPEQ